MRQLSKDMVHPEAGMTSLESIVLPLAESKALVEKGIVLETVAVWKLCHDMKWRVETRKQLRPFWGDRLERCPDYIVPAPVLSELLDAIDPGSTTTAHMVALSHALIELHEEVSG